VDKFKEILKYVWSILILLTVGWVYHLLQRMDSLKSEIAAKDAEKALGKVLDEKNKASDEARSAVDDFKRAYADYESSKDDV
jgi:hypothetical protein